MQRAVDDHALTYGVFDVLETTNLTNHLLIAMPNLLDPNFYQTVAYICMHNESGAMGIVINRAMNIELGAVLEHMQIEVTSPNANSLAIYEGGPVQRERGFVIHRPAGKWDAMITLDNDIGITTSRDVLNAIANGEGPEQVFIALGYAGWSAGQLERELSENAWLTTPVDLDILFNTPIHKRWQAAAAKLGVDLTLISSEVGHG